MKTTELKIKKLPTISEYGDGFIKFEPVREYPSITLPDSEICLKTGFANCILTVNGSKEEVQFIRKDGPGGIPYSEELKLRKENTLVNELYEQYRVALILAHGGIAK